MMHMTFYWGKTATILFDSWKTDSWGSYFLSLLACLLVSVFYQYMEDWRLRFKLTSVKAQKTPPSQTTVNSPLLFSKFAGGGSNWNASRFAGAILFGVNSAIGYLLMLAIMSFNAGVFIAVVVGLAIGYLVFRGGVEDVVVVEDNSCACS